MCSTPLKMDIEERNKLQSIKLEIEQDNDKFVSDKLKRLDDLIKRKKDSNPKNPNNITMKQHLINEHQRIKDNPIKFISERLKSLTDSIIQLEELDGDSRDK